MNVAVKKNGAVVTYGYAPEHYEGVVEFYAEALSNNEIDSFIVTKDGVEAKFGE
jgi:hypothetical protein